MQEANVDSTASTRHCAAVAFALPRPAAAPAHPRIIPLAAPCPAADAICVGDIGIASVLATAAISDPAPPRVADTADVVEDVDTADAVAAIDMANVPRTDAAGAERARLSRELHDGLGPYLTVLRLALGRAARWLPPDAPAACTEAMTLAECTLSELAGVTQDLIGSLRPAALESAFLCALCDWVEKFGHRTGIAARFSGAAEPRFHRLSAAAETAILRIVQEALNNAAKHAGAAHVDVELRYNRRYLLLSIRDDGRGLVPRERRRAATGGMGLSSMRERCDGFGGSLRIRSPRDGGVELIASLPWQAVLNHPAATRRQALQTAAP